MRATSLRLRALSFFVRALPPSRPRATAAGFFRRFVVIPPLPLLPMYAKRQESLYILSGKEEEERQKIQTVRLPVTVWP